MISIARAAASLLLLWGAAAPAFGQVDAGQATITRSPSAADPIRFGEVAPFSFTERSGATITNGDLLGAPWIGVPFFVRCTGPCPSLTADLRAILYERLEGTDIKLVSFSIDPKFDGPEALDEYAAKYSIEGDRWLFLTGDEAAMHDFVRAGLKVPVARAPEDSDVAPGEALTHSTSLPVIDAEGRIAGWYEVAATELGREGILSNFDALEARARAVAGLDPRASGTSILPAVNATLNGIAFFLLMAGMMAIKAGYRERHEHLMKLAFLASAVFLACYVYYHVAVIPLQGGPTSYHGAGWRKPAYLAMLASHVILAAVNLPMILRTFWLAHREDWVRHKRWAKVTLPIWLYVSLTGVLVYLVLYHWNPAPAA